MKYKHMKLGRTVCAIALSSIAAPYAHADGQDLFPVKQGAEWTYKGTAGDRPIEMTATVASVKTENGVTQAVIRWMTNGQATQDETYLISASSVKRQRSGKAGAMTLEPPLPVIQYPMAVGKTWKWKGAVSVQGEGTSTKIDAEADLNVAAKEKVTCGLGSLDAYRVELKLTVMANGAKQSFVNLYWFAPNAGLIKQRMDFPINGKPTKIEAALTQYKSK